MWAASGIRSVEGMITAEGLTKRYGAKTAVDDISFAVRPGQVTGFLGPNGAGKSTTMRMIVGLDRPSGGRVTVNGKPYAAHRAPLHEVGALLDAKAIHTGRTAYNHLLAMAATHGIGARRVNEVIELTGLGSVAGKRVGGFSLGMGQRLGIAAAMLGDPATLILDEPVNGLDPEGVLWVRQFVRQLAAEGRTVFLSSHLMSEMAQTADHLIVLGRGRIVADAPIADVIASGTRARVRVRSPHASQLADLLAAPEVAVVRSEAGVLDISGVEASGIGDLAALHGLAIHELTPQSASLEEAYMALTADSVEYRTEAVA
jgi:ABC-2 type transport system ATP-binding protein